MSCRGTVHRLAVAVLFTQCFSILVMADRPVGALGVPPPKTSSRDPSGPQPMSPDIPEDVELSNTSNDDVLLLIDHGADTEKSISKREGLTSTAVGGMWFGPRIGRKRSEVPSGNSAISGLWFGPRMGRDIGSDKSEFSATNGLWFGPRMGRDVGSDNGEFSAANGLWFGPRMGRDVGSDKGEFSATNGLWFGPRMGRSPGGATDDQEVARGMWFGPRMGRSSADGSNSVKENDQYRVKRKGMWMGRKMHRWINENSYDGVADPTKHDNVLLVFRRRLTKDGIGQDYRDVTERGKRDGPHMVRIRIPKNFDDNLVISKERAADRESGVGGLWFGPRMGRKRDVDWDTAAKKGREQTAEYWFGQPVVKY